MFEQGNLVRMITEEGNSEILRVVKDSDKGSGTTSVHDGEDDLTCDTDDLELVTDDQQELISIPQKTNINTIKDHELHDQLNKYIVSVIDEIRKRGFEKHISLTIDANHYNGEGVEVNYTVHVDNNYNDKVTTDNLGKSAHIALSRWEEDERNKVKAIPFYVDDVT